MNNLRVKFIYFILLCHFAVSFDWRWRALRDIYYFENSQVDRINTSSLFSSNHIYLISDEICTGDVLELKLSVHTSLTSSIGIHYSIQNAIFTSSPIIDLLSEYNSNITYHSHSSLHCLSNSSCSLNIVSITANIVDHIIILSFNDHTNQVDLSSTLTIIEAFQISPSPYGAWHGVWQSPRELHLMVSDEYMQDMMLAHTEQRFAISVRSSLPILMDSLITIPLRFNGSREDVLEFFLVDLMTMTRISNIQKLTVRDCRHHEITIPNPQYSIKDKPLPRLSFDMKGIIALTGSHGFQLPHHSIPALNSRAWSISMWLYMTADAGQEGYRNLFYKGNGIDPHRTPSAWILTATGHITIQVSTNTTPMEGFDSRMTIQRNHWIQLLFAFENISSVDESCSKYPLADTSYRMSVYIDGEEDIIVKFTDTVYMNDDSLYLFKDPSYASPIGFARDIAIWNDALSNKQAKLLYEQSINSFHQPIDVALAIMNDIKYHLPSHHFISSQLSSYITNIELHPTTSYTHIGDDVIHQNHYILNNCSSYQSRLDVYAEAASHGSLEGLYSWAMLWLYGFESPVSACGVPEARPRATAIHLHQAMVAMLYAADLGYAKALMPISVSIMIGSILRLVHHPYDIDLDKLAQAIPFPPQARHHDGSILRSPLLESIVSIISGQVHDTIWMSHTSALMRIRKLKRQYKSNALSKMPIPPGISDTPTGGSIIDELPASDDSIASAVAVGLMHLASLFGVDDANAALSYRYCYGMGVMLDYEAAAFYAMKSSDVATQEFHRKGGQPVAEADRLTDHTETSILQGNQGNQDELIQHQIIRANEGDVPAMVAIGDLYYFGARGLPRDQVQALDYYNRAASHSHTHGMCCAAAMYLKGEGHDANITKAIQLYEQASALGSTKALNGLGYMYFYGQSAPKNETKAFLYFQQAASSQQDPDSLFNVGHCWENGYGTTQDLSQAAAYYTIAAKKYGHLGAVRALGLMYFQGRGVIRSASDSLTYFIPAQKIGPWVGWLRRGFDNYAMKLYMQSINSYAYAGELGYEVAHNNAAFIIRKHLKLITSIDGDKICLSSSMLMNNSSTQVYRQLELRELILSVYQGNKENMIHIGNHHMHLFQASSTMINMSKNRILSLHAAVEWYVKASNAGSPLASLYLGLIYHYGMDKQFISNKERAIRYYTHAIEHHGLEYQLTVVARVLLHLARLEERYPYIHYFSQTVGYYAKQYLSYNSNQS